MIDRQYIPLFVFAMCLVLGLALAFFTNEWPTALAIALAGCALALAMRQPVVEDHDTAFLEEDLAEIRAASDAHGEDIAVLRTSIDEVAEIVESIAVDMQRASSGSNGADVEKLKSAVEKMGERVAALDAPHEQTATRLDALEQGLATLNTSQVQAEGVAEGVAELRRVEPVALAASGMAAASAAVVGGSARSAPVPAPSAPKSITERAGRLRERFSRGRKPRQVSVLPIFDQGRSPHSLLVDDPGETPSTEGTLAALRHALSLIGASEDADSRIFVRIPEEVIADSAFADALEPVLAEVSAVSGRLIALLPQSVVKGGPPEALALLLEAGARFGLERMQDWSADLEALAKRGLVIIAVDGPAMAKSALSQKGDPTRLRQVLHARGVELLAHDIETRMQLDAVNSLVPDLLAGPGLGEATLMDVPA